jgi:large subunit ribosomal protein L3
LSPEQADKFSVGQQLKPSEIFAEGQLVDVCGTSKGRGFTGVMKRHNFKGSRTSSHGTHEYQRHGGAIGTNMTPGRVFPGLRMPGQHGNARSTVLNLRVAKVLDESNVVLVEGGVPGARNGFVTMRSAVKAKAAKA